MAEPALKVATYEDVLAAPEHLVAEVVAGELHTQPRPASRHARASSVLGGKLGAPFDHGSSGPGGWIILDEPELHLGADILVPDMAGWRRETTPELPDTAFVEARPDWVCEVLSPSTERHDRMRKMPVYAREGVTHVWLVNPRVQTLEVFRLDGESYLFVAGYAGDERVYPEPFDAVELELGALWRW